jgi:hypothetical protein
VALGGTERIDFSVNGLVIDFGRRGSGVTNRVFFFRMRFLPRKERLTVTEATFFPRKEELDRDERAFHRTRKREVKVVVDS